MRITGMNHICFSVSDLDLSIAFYQKAFGARILVKGRKLAYFDLNGLWIALNQEDIERQPGPQSYTHIAFTVSEDEFDPAVQALMEAGAEILPGRTRDERDKRSVYFLDPDGHMFEFHTGGLEDRLNYYRAEKGHMIFYDTK